MSAIRKSFYRGGACIVTFLLLWEGGARLFLVPAVLPAPSQIVAELISYAAEGKLAYDLLMSGQRVLVGFIIGSVLGATLGLLLGSFKASQWLLEPPLQFFRFIPPIAWLTPVLIWFGIGETGKYVLIAYTTTFMVMISTYAGVAGIRHNQLRAARCLGATRWQIFRFVIIPTALPHILNGMQIGMANSLQTVVVAEMLAANEGLGFLIINSRISLSTELAYVAIVLLGVIGFLADTSFRAFTKRVTWKYKLA